MPKKPILVIVVVALVAAGAASYYVLTAPSLKVEETYSDLKLIASVSKGGFSTAEPVILNVVLEYDPKAPGVTTGWDSSQRFNAFVYDASGRMVYNWSAHQTFKHEFQVYAVTFTSGMKIEQALTWDQKNDAGQQVTSGKYRIVVGTPEFLYRYDPATGVGGATPQSAGLPPVLVTITTKSIEVNVG